MSSNFVATFARAVDVIEGEQLWYKAEVGVGCCIEGSGEANF